MWYITDPITVTEYEVWVYPGLKPVPNSIKPGKPGYEPWHKWYHDQNGVNGSCVSTDVANLRQRVLRHEGATQVDPSHWSVANAAFSRLRPDLDFERMYTQKSDSTPFKASISERLTRFIFHTKDFTNPYLASQSAFDRMDTPNVNNIGCGLDFTESNP